MQIPLSTSSATQPRICVTEKWKSFRSRFVELENPENALNEANLQRETRANQYLNVECRPGFPRGFSPNELKFSIEMRIVGIPSSTRWNRLQDNEDGSCVPRFRRQFLFLLFFLHFFSCVYWNFLTIPSGTTIFLLFFSTGKIPSNSAKLVAFQESPSSLSPLLLSCYCCGRQIWNFQLECNRTRMSSIFFVTLPEQSWKTTSAVTAPFQ